MNKQKTVNIAHKVEALAIGFIGICFFSMGTTYFQERFIYRMPRILVPVYDLFGSTALAVVMLLLGIALIVWGFSKWKSTQASSKLYLILAVVGLAAGVFLANYNFKSPEKTMQEMEEKRQTQIEEMKQTTRPDFKNVEIDQYFDAFDTLYAKLERYSTNADSVQIFNDEFYQWTSQTADLLTPLDNNPKYEFSQYYAKLTMQWSDKMQLINEQ
jgi:hypothetical protein